MLRVMCGVEEVTDDRKRVRNFVLMLGWSNEICNLAEVVACEDRHMSIWEEGCI